MPVFLRNKRGAPLLLVAAAGANGGCWLLQAPGAKGCAMFQKATVHLASEPCSLS